tara:strand:- start:363 stop:488 length:126 start_codon:yes stop_codon:yes gene_type:complete
MLKSFSPVGVTGVRYVCFLFIFWGGFMGGFIPPDLFILLGC